MGTVEHEHKDHKHHGHERRSSLRLSDLHRMVEKAVPEREEEAEHKANGKHGSHSHREHEKPVKR